MEFSVLIPVFNVEKYIRFCVSSVLAQTYQNYEIIIYDDKSTDRSGIICEELREQYPDKIEVIHGSHNIGSCAGRIELAKHASGRYCIFVDSDDLVSPKLLEIVHSAIREFSPDIVMYDMYAHYALKFGVQYNKQFHFGHEKKLYTADMMKDFYQQLATFQINAIWRKAFRREVWEQIHFNHLQYEVQIGEDLYFTLNLMKYVRSIAYIPEALYYYRCNYSSMTHVFKVNRIFDKLRVCEFFIETVTGTEFDTKEVRDSILRYVADSFAGFIASMASKSCTLCEDDRKEIYRKLASEPLLIRVVNEVYESLNLQSKDIILGLYSENFAVIEKIIRRNRMTYFMKDICRKIILK